MSPSAKAVAVALVAVAVAPAGSVRVGSQPLDVSSNGRLVWTENYGDGTVSLIAASTRRVRTFKVGGQPGGIAADGSTAWVSDLSSGRLVHLSSTGRILGSLELGGQGAGVAVAGGVVYVADYSGGVSRLSATSMKRISRTPLSGNAEAVAVGFGRLWVTNSNGTISTIDPHTGKTSGHPIHLGDDVDAVAVGKSSVWAASLYAAKIYEIDPVTRKVIRSIAMPGQCSGLLVVRGAVFVTGYDTANVWKVAQATGRVVTTYKVGRQPRGTMGFAAGHVWVANQGSDTVSVLEP